MPSGTEACTARLGQRTERRKARPGSWRRAAATAGRCRSAAASVSAGTLPGSAAACTAAASASPAVHPAVPALPGLAGFPAWPGLSATRCIATPYRDSRAAIAIAIAHREAQTGPNMTSPAPATAASGTVSSRTTIARTVTEGAASGASIPASTRSASAGCSPDGGATEFVAKVLMEWLTIIAPCVFRN